MITVFLGEYAHNVDKKGRMIIPAKFREELGEKVIITRGLDGCLSVYTLDQWQIRLQQALKLPSTKRDARMYVRMLAGKANECEIDAQGRVLIPASLIQYASIVKECIVIGCANYVEIWANEVWKAVDEEASTAFEDIAENLTEFLI